MIRVCSLVCGHGDPIAAILTHEANVKAQSLLGFGACSCGNL
ncbi:hypothetical protein AFE_0839 [Acidithiobacillus ferrooxidans ATCC 23270]|uniref:Uncharacterized protein n=1 Tax=Acidithiobacillus ferrooxidans (strain ATCC 23270 / DSM 14882 / CIP 104768 / NCIMB 8455) TaxID=243159 RepID=B7J6Q5_ACIF2|nr:hypothetical protein AFE_0839 [Acidithiobacillus ferrooxidans ATCC 23270]